MKTIIIFLLPLSETKKVPSLKEEIVNYIGRRFFSEDSLKECKNGPTLTVDLDVEEIPIEYIRDRVDNYVAFLSIDDDIDNNTLPIFTIKN